MLEEPWQIGLLGHLRVERQTVTVTHFRTQQTGALLARLALFPRRSHSREELADLLWPEDAPEAARAKLRIALSSLRRLLEPKQTDQGSVIVSDRLCIRLSSATFVTDVADFEAILRQADAAELPREKRSCLSQALALYAGELLPGLYDDWIVLERERLEALRDQAQYTLESLVIRPPDVGFPAVPLTVPPDTCPTLHVSLPLRWTRFFGRETERKRLQDWLGPVSGTGAARMVTLMGPGGVGKTRLALEAADHAADGSTTAVCFVGLADARNGCRLLSRIAECLGLSHTEADEEYRAVFDRLNAGPSLVILDNLEQIADEIAPQVQRLLAQIPALRFLATSRRALGLPGEQMLLIEPLPVPEEGDPASEAFPGVALFVDRAQLSRADFVLTLRNAEAVGQLCRRLDGLPLALELASAWIGVLTPAQMLARMDARQSLLVSRRKGVPERQQTLELTLDWSWDLLPPTLQQAWSRLSVFRGGWTSEAMAAFYPDGDAPEILARLRERSLVIAEETKDGTSVRFRMLETLREYGAAHMEESKCLVTRECHAQHFIGLAERAAPHLRGSEQAQWLDGLEQERANLCAALEWSMEDASGETGDVLGLSMAGALASFWMRRGPLAEGRAYLTTVLAQPGAQAETRERASALNGCGLIAWMQADYECACACHEEALTIRRTLGDSKAIAASLGNLGLVAVERRDHETARRLGEEALALNRAAGDLRGQSIDLNNLGDVATHQGRHDDARALYEESLALRRRAGDWAGEAITLGNLGLNAAVFSDYQRAVDYHQQALRLRWEAGDEWRMTFSLSHLADTRRRQRLWDIAARLYGAAQALRDRIHLINSPVRQEQWAAELTALRESLGADAFTSSYDAGCALSLESAVEFALTASQNP